MQQGSATDGHGVPVEWLFWGKTIEPQTGGSGGQRASQGRFPHMCGGAPDWIVQKFFGQELSYAVGAESS